LRHIELREACVSFQTVKGRMSNRCSNGRAVLDRSVQRVPESSSHIGIMSTTLKLMADYGGTVLWRLDGDQSGPIELDAMNALPIPAELQHTLQEWAGKYDATLNQDYPPDSGFASDEDELAFEIEGKRLWESLKLALGADWEVFYFSNSEGRLLN
jgi:hypothetical protein